MEAMIDSGDTSSVRFTAYGTILHPDCKSMCVTQITKGELDCFRALEPGERLNYGAAHHGEWERFFCKFHFSARKLSFELKTTVSYKATNPILVQF